MVAKGDLIGRIAGRNKKLAEEVFRNINDIPKNTKLHLEFLYSDEPFKIYEVTSLGSSKTKKTARKK